MLGLDYSAVRYTWSVASSLLLLSVIHLIRETLFLIVVALLFAYLLWPLVDFFDRRLRKNPLDFGRRSRSLGIDDKRYDAVENLGSAKGSANHSMKVCR